MIPETTDIFYPTILPNQKILFPSFAQCKDLYDDFRQSSDLRKQSIASYMNLSARFHFGFCPVSDVTAVSRGVLIPLKSSLPQVSAIKISLGSQLRTANCITLQKFMPPTNLLLNPPPCLLLPLPFPLMIYFKVVLNLCRLILTDFSLAIRSPSAPGMICSPNMAASGMSCSLNMAARMD